MHLNRVWDNLSLIVFFGSTMKRMMMVDTTIINGLYAITPDEPDTDKLSAKVLAALEGGARLFQYRAKNLNETHQFFQAEVIKQLCDRYNANLIINDNAELCLHLDAFGVHLGKDDSTIESARKIIGAEKVIGVSCYNSSDRVAMAQDSGADYLALGAFFNTSTKPKAPKASLSLFKKVRAQSKLPIVAIGGITLENAPSLIIEGIKTMAVINSLFMSDNIEATTKQFINLLSIDEKL